MAEENQPKEEKKDAANKGLHVQCILLQIAIADYLHLKNDFLTHAFIYYHLLQGNYYRVKPE